MDEFTADSDIAPCGRRIKTDALEDATQQYVERLERALSAAYVRGAVAVDVIHEHGLVGPPQNTADTTVKAWFVDPPDPVDEYDHQFVERYDLTNTDPSEFLEHLDASEISWDDITDTPFFESW